MRHRSRSVFALAFVALTSLVDAHEPRTLRVCADPGDLPFSNRAQAGFENAIVGVVAKSLNARVEYVWWPQLRGFARKTLDNDTCDLWPGVPVGMDSMAVTQPYYRSSYVFVTRDDRHLDLRSFDDPRLGALVIGVQLIGNDATNTPPAHALARRGIAANVRGYMVYDVRAASSPIVSAVADRTLDVAIVWGPTAGYFAKTSGVPLRLEPTPSRDGNLPMTFAISMGVRKDNIALRDEIDGAFTANKVAIGGILDQFGVPR
jgi:mxaJ protein